jgi:hypothetical protein
MAAASFCAMTCLLEVLANLGLEKLVYLGTSLARLVSSASFLMRRKRIIARVLAPLIGITRRLLNTFCYFQGTSGFIPMSTQTSTKIA